MIAGIMQPYFFPYFGYFDLISRCDQWVVFDIVQYTPKSWMNRNRILHPTRGWQYVSVPVKHAFGDRIQDIRVVDMAGAERRILGQIAHYRGGRAPFFDAVHALVRAAFAGARSDRLRDLNVAAMLAVCRYLGIACDWRIWSEAGIALPPIRHAGQWALEISAAIGASDYLNPEAGRAIFRAAEFRARGVGLHFRQHFSLEYACGAYAFVPDLSIIDVLMWNDPARIRSILDERRSAPGAVLTA